MNNNGVNGPRSELCLYCLEPIKLDRSYDPAFFGGSTTYQHWTDWDNEVYCKGTETLHQDPMDSWGKSRIDMQRVILNLKGLEADLR